MESFARKLQPCTEQAGFLALRSSRSAPSHMLCIQWIYAPYSLITVTGSLGPHTRFPFHPDAPAPDALATLIWNLYTMTSYHPVGALSSTRYKPDTKSYSTASTRAVSFSILYSFIGYFHRMGLPRLDFDIAEHPVLPNTGRTEFHRFQNRHKRADNIHQIAFPHN